MALPFWVASQPTSGSFGSGQTYSRPGAAGNLADQDVLLWEIEFSSDPGAITIPAGWQLVRATTNLTSGTRLRTYLKFVDVAAGEPTSYACSWAIGSHNRGSISIIRGVKFGAKTVADAIDDHKENVSTATSTAHVAPGVVTTGPDRLVWLIYVSPSNGSYSGYPTEVTERYDHSNTLATVQAGAGADYAQAAAATTTTKAATFTSATHFACQAIAFKPAATNVNRTVTFPLSANLSWRVEVQKILLLSLSLLLSVIRGTGFTRSVQFLVSTVLNYSRILAFGRTVQFVLSPAFSLGPKTVSKVRSFVVTVANSPPGKQVRKTLGFVLTPAHSILRNVQKQVVFNFSASLSTGKVIQKIVSFQLGLSAIFDGARQLATTVADKLKDLTLLLSGRRGQIGTRYRLLLSNALGEEGKEIRGVNNVTVDMSNYRDAAWAISLNAIDAGQFDPITDYVKPVMEVRGKDGWERFPLGLYRMDAPSAEHWQNLSKWSLKGYSPEALILDDEYDDGYVAKAGIWILATVKSILTTKFNVPASMIDLPVTDKQLTSDRFFDASTADDSTKGLRIINDLLNAGGWYALFADANGRLTTRVIDPVENRYPDVQYGPAFPLSVRGGVQDEHDDSEFANIVVVRVQDVNVEPPMVARVENHDPNSPGSIENFRRRRLKTVTLQSATDQAVVDQRAAFELAVRSGRLRKASIATMPDPRRGPKEVYELQLPRKNKEPISGLWRVVNWSLPLTEQVSDMTHQLSRWERL